uniref:Uncharacterized protein n=1 Tax=Strigamia maritima TaxID=126957 RepID=T1J9W5_STRMM
MFNTWIYLSISFCCFSGVFSDAEHLGEIQALLIPNYEQCLKDDGYILENEIRTHDNCVVVETRKLWKAYGMNSFEQLKKLICQENAFTECYDSANKKLQKCLEFERKDEGFVDAMNSLNAVIRYLCGNSQEQLNRFMEEPARKCLNTQETRIGECGSKSKNINDVWFQKSFRMNPFCDLRGKWGKCVVDTLDECDDKTAMEVTKAVISASLMASPCKETIDKDHSDFSGAVTVLLNNYLILVPLISTFAAILLT